VSGDPRFHALLAEIAELHDRKQADYGRTADPFANVRATEEWGMPGWVGAMMRLNDKVRRLQKFAQVGSLANESAEDSMRDIAVYALIALILYRESAGERPASPAPSAATSQTFVPSVWISRDGTGDVETERTTTQTSAPTVVMAGPAAYVLTKKFCRTGSTGE
jgi:hypothetical protein